jgi:hypothetical protein
MMPNLVQGPRGGKYVLTTTNQKIYIPKDASFTKEGMRWRIKLRNGGSMLLPQLAKN